MVRSDPLLSRTIGGKYRVLECIGGGGFGKVYRAEHQPVGRIVALKVINESVQNEPELRQRFLREARSVALLKSTHVVPLFDFGEEADGLLYMVFEFIEGRTLKDILITDGALAINDAVRYSIEILEGLSEAHENGIIHRDLKPANIMITPGSWGQSQARILDFGVAKMLDTENIDALELTTQQGIVLGTPHYMSPEQARNKGVDRRADIYALGTLIYTMVAGRPPYLAESIFDVIKKQIDEPVSVPLQRLNMPEEFCKVLAKAMAKSPKDRFQNARDMAEALAPFAHHSVQRDSVPMDTAPEIDPLAIQSKPSIQQLQPSLTNQSTVPPSPSRRLMVAALLSMVLIAGGWWLATDPLQNGSPDQTSEADDHKAAKTHGTEHRTSGPTSRAQSPQNAVDLKTNQPSTRSSRHTPNHTESATNQVQPADKASSHTLIEGTHSGAGEPAVDERRGSKNSKADGVSKNRQEGTRKTRKLPRKRLRRDRKKTVAVPPKKKSSKEALTVPEF